MGDRLIGFTRSLGDEGALGPTLDLEPAMERPVLAQLDAPDAAHGIVFPGPLPPERGARFRGPHIDLGEKAMHTKSVRVPGEG